MKLSFPKLLLLGLAICLVGHAVAQPIPGKVYEPQEVQDLVGQTVNDPTYLIGDLTYDVSIQGMPFFVACDGSVIVHIAYPHGLNPSLTTGQRLSLSAEHPLTILSVTHSNDDPFVYVEAEDRSDTLSAEMRF